MSRGSSLQELRGVWLASSDGDKWVVVVNQDHHHRALSLSWIRNHPLRSNEGEVQLDGEYDYRGACARADALNDVNEVLSS